MNNVDILVRLRSLEPELRRRGIAALFLYGSTARGEAKADSDVDLFCELAPTFRLGFGFFALADRISETLGRPVDLATRAGLHPLIRDAVAREAVQVF